MFFFKIENRMRKKENPVFLSKLRYDNYDEEKLQCNDGSPGGFYYRPSTDAAGENRH